MENILDKKLFEEICGIKAYGRITLKDDCIYYNYGFKFINFSSFILQCKEWALSFGYILKSWDVGCEIIPYNIIIKSNTELNSILKACVLIKKINFLLSDTPSFGLPMEFVLDKIK